MVKIIVVSLLYVYLAKNLEATIGEVFFGILLLQWLKLQVWNCEIPELVLLHFSHFIHFFKTIFLMWLNSEFFFLFLMSSIPIHTICFLLHMTPGYSASISFLYSWPIHLTLIPNIAPVVLQIFASFNPFSLTYLKCYIPFKCKLLLSNIFYNFTFMKRPFFIWSPDCIKWVLYSCSMHRHNVLGVMIVFIP